MFPFEGKPTVHYSELAGILQSGQLMLHAVDHPAFPANYPVITTAVEHLGEGKFESLNTIYVPMAPPSAAELLVIEQMFV